MSSQTVGAQEPFSAPKSVRLRTIAPVSIRDLAIVIVVRRFPAFQARSAGGGTDSTFELSSVPVGAGAFAPHAHFLWLPPRLLSAWSGRARVDLSDNPVFVEPTK